MDIRLQIKSLLNEAELYRAQGLNMEAKAKYESAATLLKGIDNLKNKERLLENITIKIKSLEEKEEKAQSSPVSRELSEKGQDLIKNLFGEDDLEKAIALIKFGQFERAIVELTPMLKDDKLRVEVAKHILQCKIAADSMDAAIDQYKKWHTSDLFSAEQITALHRHLRKVLDQNGIATPIPGPATEEFDEFEEEVTIDPGSIDFLESDSNEEILDVTSIGITFTSGAGKGKMVEFDVNFQSGDMLSLIISNKDKGLIEELKDGDKLDDIQFYSPIAIFKGTAVITNKTKIDAGPKKGDYCLDLKVTST